MTKLRDGNFAVALMDFDRLVLLKPSTAGVYIVRSCAREALGDYDGAIDDESRAIQFDPDTPDYYRRRGISQILAHETEADFLAAASPKETHTGWRLDSRALAMSDLASPTPQTDPAESGKHCEAWFYSGIVRLLAGDKATAAEQFRKCVATKRTSYVKYRLAGWELKVLEP